MVLFGRRRQQGSFESRYSLQECQNVALGTVPDGHGLGRGCDIEAGRETLSRVDATFLS